MSEVEKITKEFMKKTIRPNSQSRFPILMPEDALNYIMQCVIADGELLGIEGFLINGVKIQPVQEISADIDNFGRNKIVGECGRIILPLVKSKNIAFEVVFN